MTRHQTPATATFIGAASNRLVADVFGDGGSPALLLHGGGQTRHAWKKTAQEIARRDHTAYALDQRGHGDSDWVDAYNFAFQSATVRMGSRCTQAPLSASNDFEATEPQLSWLKVA